MQKSKPTPADLLCLFLTVNRWQSNLRRHAILRRLGLHCVRQTLNDMFLLSRCQFGKNRKAENFVGGLSRMGQRGLVDVQI